MGYDYKTANKRAEYFESLGFQIEGCGFVSLDDFEFDLSAVDLSTEAVLYTVIKQAFKQGKEQGINETQTALKALLGIKDEIS